MTLSDIYKNVRWCFDEESVNGANFDAASAYSFDGETTDTGLMNNIIKAKLSDAIRWVCLFAPAEQLSGGGDDTGTSLNIVVDETGKYSDANHRIKLGNDFIRLVRVRGNLWHRAVMGDSLLKEDSDEYLQLMDSDGAAATKERPQAALIETAEKQVEVWPDMGAFELTKLRMPTASEIASLSDNSNVNIPPLLQTSFLYYLAFLVLSAYEDSRANSMLEIAKMNLGMTGDKQRA